MAAPPRAGDGAHRFRRQPRHAEARRLVDQLYGLDDSLQPQPQMVAGHVVEDDGRTTLRAGDSAAWPKGSTNGHHLRNESSEDCSFIVIGGGTNTGGGYSDIDLAFTPEGRYVHKNGNPY